MFTPIEKFAIVVCTIFLALLFANAYAREKAICERHFPDAVHECIWSAKYKVTADG